MEVYCIRDLTIGAVLIVPRACSIAANVLGSAVVD